MKSDKKIFFLAVIIISGFNASFAQSLRDHVNEGVENYNEENYPDAEVNFKKGVDKSTNNFEARFNLGDALFKQERYDEAMNSYQSSLPLARNELEKAQVHYNIGNSLLMSQKIKESIEEYKQSLKLNPNDAAAKYNLSYALNMLKDQDQQQQQQNQDQNQNKDQEQNQQQDQQKNQQQQDQNKQEQQQNQQDKKQQQQQPQKISKEEAERILEALKDNEKDLQKELRKIKGKKVKTDKDW
jgi:tetratricopeptide (TPR) repeat protein